MDTLISNGWAWYVAIMSILSILACAWILKANSVVHKKEGEAADMHGTHEWDGLREYDNPLPKWWAWLFYITIAFALVYLALYPGLIVTKGLYAWSSSGQHKEEVALQNAETDPIFNAYLKQDVKTVSLDKGAAPMGARLFQTYCVQCHGSDMHGSKGFPNLVDNDWLYGGTPEAIETSISEGRTGAMPAFAEQLKPEQIKTVAQYVQSLSGTPAVGSEGETLFKANCVACHGPEGKGNVAMGAPNLTDKVWLYGGGLTTISETIAKGRQGKMPSHKDLLGPAKVHLLAAYVYGQSQDPANAAEKK